MATPGPVLLKRFTCNSKYDPLVEEVELLEANPRYNHVRFSTGSEDTVANKHFAHYAIIRKNRKLLLNNRVIKQT